jgi:hypothetical protein
MSYSIYLQWNNTYAIQFDDPKIGLVTLCPCCDKPLDTWDKAVILADNLLKLNEKADKLAKNLGSFY